MDPEALVSGASVLFVPEPKPSGEQNWDWCAVGRDPIRGLCLQHHEGSASTLPQDSLRKYQARHCPQST